MLLEKLAFNLIAFSLFTVMFFKMIRKNDTNYIVILAIQALGIAINFVEILFNSKLGILFKTILYLLSIVLPLAVLYIESKGINFSEIMYLSLAKICLAFNDSKAAKNFLIKLADKYPNSYLGHKLLAQIYEKEGGMRKAIDEYVQAIDIKKNDYDTYFKIAFLLDNLDRKDESVTMLQNLLEKKPDYYEASDLLGTILYQKEDFKGALSVYTDALKYNPVSFDIYYNLGMIYTRLNDFPNAKACYQRAAELNSLLYNASYTLGQIALVYRDLEEAEQYFMKSIQGAEVEADSYYQLAKIYMLKGEREKAVHFVNTAIELEPYCSTMAKEEPLFMPVKDRISFRKNGEVKPPKVKLSPKEIAVRKHLEKTQELIGKLSYNEYRKLYQKPGRKLVKEIEQEEIETEAENIENKGKEIGNN